MTSNRSANKGEWSELYAFIKLLKDGRVYAADENVNRLADYYLPILKIIRQETQNAKLEFVTEETTIKVFQNGSLIEEITKDVLEEKSIFLFQKIFKGTADSDASGAFRIEELNDFMDQLHIERVKAPSNEKIDIKMQIHDVNTGYKPEVGFSMKSDIGSAPTLMNPGKNTRVRYRITGLSKSQIDEINGINELTDKEYMKARMNKLFMLAASISFDRIKDETFNNNLMMIDSFMPRIYGEIVLSHFRNIEIGIYECDRLLSIITNENPLNYPNTNLYEYKFKRLISASALGMTPGKQWNGNESATGGYIIIKRDGDVLCYHIYNRNFFESYLLKNTRLDRPSASRYDYGYIYEDNAVLYIDLNVQIRFKSIR